MNEWRLTLSILPDLFAVCRLPARTATPAWAHVGAFTSVTRTGDEVSIVCSQAAVPAGVQLEGEWRCLKVDGPFPLDGAVGVVAALTVPLAAAGVSIFIISTYDTDYLLVKQADLVKATDVLARAGHSTRS